MSRSYTSSPPSASIASSGTTLFYQLLKKDFAARNYFSELADSKEYETLISEIVKSVKKHSGQEKSIDLPVNVINISNQLLELNVYNFVWR
jgi:hypothetical protein